MDPLDAQIRQVYFFDTPDLALDAAGVVVRARRVQGKGDDSVIKLRPVVPAELPAGLRRSPALRRRGRRDARRLRLLGVAEGAAEDPPWSARRCTASATAPQAVLEGAARVLRRARAGRARARRPDRSSARSSCSSCKCAPPGFGRRLVAELWLYPDGSRILELSTKCAPPRRSRSPRRRARTSASAASTLGRAADQDAHGARVLQPARRSEPLSAARSRRSWPSARRSAGRWDAALMHASQRREARPRAVHPAPARGRRAAQRPRLRRRGGRRGRAARRGREHRRPRPTTSRRASVPRVAATVAAVTEDPRIGDYGERKAALRDAGGGRGRRRARGLRGRQDRQGARAARARRERPGGAVRPGAPAASSSTRAQPRPAARRGREPRMVDQLAFELWALRRRSRPAVCERGRRLHPIRTTEPRSVAGRIGGMGLLRRHPDRSSGT